MLKQLFTLSGRKINIQLLSVVFLFPITEDAFSQSSGQSKKIGSAASVYQMLHSPPVNGLQNIKTIETPDGQLSVEIKEQSTEYVVGKIAGNPTSRVFFNYSKGNLDGKTVIPNQHKAYNFYTDEQNNLVVENADINKVICTEYPVAPQEENTFEDNGKRSAVVPAYNSLPGATAVIMMDFDGFNCSGQPWGPINAASANFTDAKIKTAWEITAEDYRPYQINVTTDEAVYQAAPQNQRRRAVITPTDDAANGAGGVSYIGVFSDGNDNNVAWVFNVGGNGRVSGETVSHEIGHNVGLNHDGPNYYMGHSNKAWAPIMGAAYDDQVGQWSKGEYTGADNQEDDVAIIGANVFGFRADEAGDNIAGAKALVVGSGGVVNENDNYGVITKSTDMDVYSFTCGAGQVTLNVGTTYAQPVPDLDVLLKLTNAQGTDVVSPANPTGTMSATIIANITTPGTYYLSIDGTGKDNPVNTGYSDFASIGEYTISGNVPIATNINEVSKLVSFETYPNPSSGQVFIRISNPAFKNQVKVTNIFGEEIYNMVTNSGQAIVDLTNHAQGIYFISVTNNDGTTTIKQLID